MPGETVAHVKPSDVGIAAAHVIRMCVGGSPPQAGVAQNRGRWHVQILALKSEPSSILLTTDTQETLTISRSQS